MRRLLQPHHRRLNPEIPRNPSEVKSWAKSKNRWLKRAAAVSLIVPAKKGCFLQDALEICDVLLVDRMIWCRKVMGGCLKRKAECIKRSFRLRCKKQGGMPRTALRYAIELMPQELRLKGDGEGLVSPAQRFLLICWVCFICKRQAADYFMPKYKYN